MVAGRVREGRKKGAGGAMVRDGGGVEGDSGGTLVGVLCRGHGPKGCGGLRSEHEQIEKTTTTSDLVRPRNTLCVCG